MGVGEILLAKGTSKPVPQMAWKQFDVDEGKYAAISPLLLELTRSHSKGDQQNMGQPRSGA
jgi:hypothetical protein